MQWIAIDGECVGYDVDNVELLNERLVEFLIKFLGELNFGFLFLSFPRCSALSNGQTIIRVNRLTLAIVLAALATFTYEQQGVCYRPMVKGVAGTLASLKRKYLKDEQRK